MDVSNLLADGHSEGAERPHPTSEGMPPNRQYMTRQSIPPYSMQHQNNGYTVSSSYQEPTHFSPTSSLSPVKAAEPKHVSFELLFSQSPQHRARLPMRVNIFPHDTTDSIITTVKNFYGLYERRGVCFEDRQGNTLIARYENFEHNMVVYVRVTNEEVEPEVYSPVARESLSPRRPRLDEPFQMLPPSVSHQLGRPASRTARQRSGSPHSGRGRRSASASTNPRPRNRPAAKSRTGSSHGSFADAHGDGYSDSDGGNGSVTSSRRGRAEQLASAEISLDNIVEGGRRKRAKFDSSELPLFVPPQVPMTTSVSSVSPQRRISSQNGASPYSYTNQQTFSYIHPLPSPQSYGHGEVSYLQGLSTPYSASNGQPHGHRSRTRGSVQYAPNRLSANGGIFPTPDPTNAGGSVISDEDVALQLMRLGDASNISAHGRTSTSTLDDAFSGKAEAASSSEESDEGSDVGEGELPMLPYGEDHVTNYKQEPDSGETSGEEEDYEDDRDESFKGGSDEIMPDADHQGSHSKTNGSISSKGRSSISGSKHSKSGRPRGPSSKKSKVPGGAKTPISPTSLPPQSRKASSASLNFQHQLGVDEEDLSTKPRCQRCRKSKKGCDRQRPCQRCKDAGIGIDGCVSEDEGNGRKGRYGRHMGVPVKKSSDDVSVTDGIVSAPPSAYSPMSAVSPDKSKKRKR